MEFVSPIIGPIVQSLMVPVKKHLGFLVSSTKYVKKMEARMKQIEEMAKEVQDERDMALIQTEVLPAYAESWLQEVENLKKGHTLKEKIGCFNVARRYKVGKHAYGILEEIKDLENRKSKIVFTHEQVCLAEVGSTSTGPSTSAPVSTGTQSDFESRDLIFNAALQALQSDKETHNMIALCGMGGVGKTTMMEQLKKAVEDSGTFNWVVKVVIGENTDPNSIQQDIAQYVGGRLNETTIHARADRLRKIFEAKSQQSQKKNLVIMDDLWKEVNLADFGLKPLPNGFKLLFTSRFENVCNKIGVTTESIFRVGVLSDTEAKALFLRMVGPCPSDGDEDEFQKIGEDIVKKCKGLPIAIVTIAKSLIGNIKEAWKEALFNLQHDDLQDLNDIVHKVFEMSYDNLKNQDDKAIFLLSGLFPDDFNIPIEKLMLYAWGLKLFAKVHTLTGARRHANISVNNLIRANLLIASDRVGCVKMHDLIRAFVLTNFSKVKQASIVNHDNMSWERLPNDSYERILLKCTSMFGLPADFNYPNLSLLILMDGYKLFQFPEDIHRRMKNLEVVSCENMGIPMLPITFEHSTTLRTLYLYSCSLTNDISYLGNLCNLEILSLVSCSIRRLPSAIGKLKKLRLLDLRGCDDLYIDHGVFQNLESLEELYMRASSCRSVNLTHANCNELEKLSHRLFALDLEFVINKPQLKNMSFKNLERFRISFGCELRTNYYYSFKNTLNLVVECNELKDCDIRDIFKKTEDLRLQVKDMIHLEDVSLKQSFSQLRSLHISKCEELEYLFTVDMANDLKTLEQLTISECPVLQTLISENGGVGVVTLNRLKIMSLEDLPKMVSLCDSVIELPELVELRLSALPNFTSIYSHTDNNTSAMQPLFKKEVMLAKLEKLYIIRMENVKQIWPCQISTSEKNDVSMLRRISVTECDRLINLFPINPLPLLNHLEEVVVKNCGSIEVLFNIDFESVCEMGKCSKLRKIEVEDLMKLKELWRMKGVNESHTLVNCFKDVQTIHIERCYNFTDIFTPTTTNFDLGALTNYDLKNISMPGIDKEIIVTYPSCLLHSCHHLQHLELWSDVRVKVVFDMDSPSTRQLATIQPPLLLPDLQTIKLEYLKEMSHVWKCSWNKLLIPQHQPLQFLFQTLTNIFLYSCPKIKYLFSPLMVKYLSNLKKVNLQFCDSMEEVISSRDDKYTTSTSSNQNNTLFPRLDTLDLVRLECLKCIDGEKNTWRDKISSNITNSIHDHLQSAQVTSSYWSLCQYTRKISISSCDALSSLISWYGIGQMKRLEELEIENCSRMTEVFENESINNYTNNVDEGSEQSGAVTSLTRPSQTNITIVVVPQLSNLKSVFIRSCDNLPHVFTFSTLESLKQLNVLKVKICSAIQVIVKEENETSSEEVVVFPHLETLELDCLPNLKGFFLGVNDFHCPSLINVMINDCPQWEMFTSGQLKTPKLKNVLKHHSKYSLECGFNFQTTFPTSSDPTNSKETPFSFHNLIELHKSCTKSETIIPSHALLQLQKLQKISIRSSDSVKEVFEVVALEETNKSKTVVKIPNLTQLKIYSLDALKYLWKSNQWMVLEFPNLTTVEISVCKSLKHVFTCSIIGSLVNLQDLHVSGCWDIEVIVKEEEECEDAIVNEVMLPRLKSLKLENLYKLKGFCLGKEAFSLPSLDTLEIKSCDEITVFTKGHVSTPVLKLIDTNFGFCYVNTDINSLIKTKREEGHKFSYSGR